MLIVLILVTFCVSTGLCDQPGLVCYTCPLQRGHTACNKITVCETGQVCGIRHLEMDGGPDDLFETKCFNTNECSIDTPGFLSASNNDCRTCCNSTLCNKYDPRVTCNGYSTFTTNKMTTSQPATQSVVTTKMRSSTTQITPRPEAVLNPDCHDLYVGCKANFELCQLPLYTEWTRIGCQKTCGYCIRSVDPSPVG